jgi:hypothetical protein
LVLGCKKRSNERSIDVNYNPVIDPADFVATVDNQYFPLIPGTTFHYENTTEEGIELDTVTVTHDTKVILGVTCVVVHDVVTLGRLTVEDTLDWYAQDTDGNVWYFGEDTQKLEDGGISTEGSWEAGVDGAKPGIVIQGNPQIGAPYRQEYLFNVAEDMAQVIGVGETVTVPYGTFPNCIKTKDWSAIEPDVVENKYFCPGIGQLLAETVQGGTEREVLVSITPP